MRGFLFIISLVALLTVGGGTYAIVTGYPAGRNGEPDRAALPHGTSAPVEDISTTPPTSTPSPTVDGAPSVETETPTATEPQTSEVSIELPPVEVKAPSMELYTTGLDRVEGQYSERYTFGNITVAWRPGAFPPERAEEVARQTEAAIQEANEKLHTRYDGEAIIFLADQLFAEDCHGCQGYTAADRNWVFMLADGSVATDEFEALLVHEITHLIAAQLIFLPHDLFFAEGLATWVMTDDLINAGYVSPVQTTAWTYRAGALPPLEALFDDDFGGRMRKRVAYDASAAFAFFVIEEYGWAPYRRLYTRDTPEFVFGTDWATIEAKWHAYLDRYADNVVNGVNAQTWWAAASQVIDGFVRFYDAPSLVTADQYRELTLARLALNRGLADLALQHLAASGLGLQTAQ